MKDSQLNYLIPPEIKDDEFYHLLQFIAQQPEVKTILEIGSSSGEGSTEAFVAQMRQLPDPPLLFCMEVSRVRFAALQHHYRDDAFVRCYNVSSVGIDRFPDAQEVTDFYQSRRTNLNGVPLSVVLGWRQQDIDYIRESGVEVDGIRRIQRERGIETFDAVLIDGSEFTGKAELADVYGATYLCLDDVNAFKNLQNFEALSQDPQYALVASNFSLRNGYAVFKKLRPQGW